MGFWGNDTPGKSNLQINKWYHLAFVYDKDQKNQTIYLDGALEATSANHVPFQGNDVLNVARCSKSAHFKGKMAHLRIYDIPLTQDEIKRVIISDQSAQAAFKVEYPLEFTMIDDNERNVLYISDDAGLNTFQVDIENTSHQNIKILPLPKTATPEEKFTFKLRFKPKTFEKILDGTKLYIKRKDKDPDDQDYDNWHVNDANFDPKTGMVSVSILYKGQQPVLFNAKEKRTFFFQYKSADGTGGSRGTQVEMAFKHIQYENDIAAIEGKARIINVDIINQRGKKNIPLQVGIVGSNTIINDTTANLQAKQISSQKTIRIANTLKDDQSNKLNNRILFNKDNNNTTRNTKFTILFDDPVGDAWDLASPNQLNGINISNTALFTVKKDSQGNSPTFEITPKKDFLEPQQYIDISLENIYTDKPSGMANIYIKYENILGYWDGQFVVQVEKSPVMHADMNGKKNVGIGTAPNTHDRLLVNGNATINGKVRIGPVPNTHDLLTVNGNATINGEINAGNSDIYFTKTNHNHTAKGNTFGHAAIENSERDNALMILGRSSSRSKLHRVVKLFDYLRVYGTLDVSENMQVLGSLRVNSHMEVDKNLTVDGHINAGNSDLYFTKKDHNHTGYGNEFGHAAIENARNYNALMILGRQTGTKNLHRVVKLWDYLQVNGNLDVTNNLNVSKELVVNRDIEIKKLNGVSPAIVIDSNKWFRFGHRTHICFWADGKAKDNDSPQLRITSGGIEADNVSIKGSLYLKGKEPIIFKKFTMPRRDNYCNTQIKASEYTAAVVGFQAIGGDIDEGGSDDIIKVYTYVNNGIWYIYANFHTHRYDEQWIIDVMFVRNEMCKCDYNPHNK
jgi:hypothetical protein